MTANRNRRSDTGSSHWLLRAVQAVTISPEEAEALARRYRGKARANGHFGRAEVEEAAAYIVRRYARLSAGVGGVTGLTGIVPGVGQAVAAGLGGTGDALATMRFQVNMAMCLAALHGYDLTREDARHLAFLIAAGGALERAGEKAVTRVASKAGVKLLRQYLRGASLQVVKQVFRRVGIVFTRKALEKAIPFGIGVVVGAGGNYAMTAFVGRQACEWFRIDAADGGPDATLR